MSPQPGFKINELIELGEGKDKIKLIINSIKLILEENKNNIKDILNDLKSNKDQFLCTDIDRLLEELYTIRTDLNNKNDQSKIGLINFVIYEIQEIRIKVIKVLMTKNNSTRKVTEKGTIKKKSKTNIYDYITNKVESAEDLMTFYSQKNSSISNSNNKALWIY